MAKKNKPDNRGYVFSTDPSFPFEQDHEKQETLPAAGQELKIKLETKQRGGKAVTLVTGFRGTVPDLEALGKQLKNICGAGGSAKDGEIIIQGDKRRQVLDWLQKNGYKRSKII